MRADGRHASGRAACEAEPKAKLAVLGSRKESEEKGMVKRMGRMVWKNVSQKDSERNG